MLNIMTVSLESTKRHAAFAVYDGEKLAITHCLPLQGKPSEFGPKLLQDIKERSEKGFSVLVEDRTGRFVVGDATQFSFDEIDEGRSMLFHSLDWYFAMLDLGNIIADTSVERFLIRSGGEGQKIERLQDERGKTIYKVNWESMNGGIKAVLMAVSAAMMQPLSDRFITEMYGYGKEEEEVRFDPHRTFNAITVGVVEGMVSNWNQFYDAKDTIKIADTFDPEVIADVHRDQ